MKTILSCLAAIGMTAVRLCAAQDDLDSQIQALEKVGQDFAGAAAVSGSMANSSPDLKAMVEEYRSFSNNFGSVQSYLQNNDYDQAVRMLKRWLSQTKNEQIRTSLTKLVEALQAQRKKQVEALTKKVDEKIAATAAGVAKATTPDEVESLRLDLEEFRNEECNTSSRETQRLSNRLSRAVSFLESWRQFVAAQSDGDYQQALSYLTNVRRNGGNVGIISSKDLADRYAGLLEKQLANLTDPDAGSPVLKAIAGIMEKVKSGKDAPAAASKIAVIQSIANGADSRLLSTLQTQLDQIGRMQRDFDDGIYGRVLGNSDFSSGMVTPYDDRCAQVRSELKTRAIVATSQLESFGTPKPGESFAQFLRSAADIAFEKKDWARLAVILPAYSAASG